MSLCPGEYDQPVTPPLLGKVRLVWEIFLVLWFLCLVSFLFLIGPQVQRVVGTTLGLWHVINTDPCSTSPDDFMSFVFTYHIMSYAPAISCVSLCDLFFKTWREVVTSQP